MCGTAMPQVNSEANTPPGTPAWCSLLADDHRVGAVAATAADLLGEVRAQQARLSCGAVQFARELAGAFPLVDVRQDLAFGE